MFFKNKEDKLKKKKGKYSDARKELKNRVRSRN